MSKNLPPVAVLVSHRVADYDTWKTGFDEHKSARAEAGCFGHHLNVGIDDPKMVHVYCPAGDADKLKAFVDSERLAQLMKEIGVEGPPSITFLVPKHGDFISDRRLAGIIVKHEVESYDRWRAAYDEFDVLGRGAGIIGHAHNQELGQPNQVLVYNQAEDVDTLRAFVESAELREGMAKAGVTGAPDIQFVQSVDYEEYGTLSG